MQEGQIAAEGSLRAQDSAQADKRQHELSLSPPAKEN